MTPIDPKTRASQLINAFAQKSALLEAATAPTRAEITALTAALNEAALPHKMALEALEAEANALALEHGAAIFGEDKRSLTENGFTLAVRETEAVACEDEESTLHMLMKDAARCVPGSDSAMALNACMRVTRGLNKEYVLDHYSEAPEWFAAYGLSVVDKSSASLKPAPKPRAPKAAKKLKTPAVAVEEEGS